MGIVLDSSVLIAAERERRPVSQLLSSLGADYADTRMVVSSVTVMELEHGWHRAVTPESALKRRQYIDELLSAIPTEPFTHEMGVLGARIDADLRKSGFTMPTSDLLPGITALYLGYDVGTRNVRHFRTIPGLNVIIL